MNEKYSGNDNNGKPKSEYLKRISGMSIEHLRRETRDEFWFSAYAHNNPAADCHWHAHACYDELMKRTGNDDEFYQVFC